MYNMHKFFARKQEDVINEYIKAYTNEGDIVLDPFCGSGVMVAEALRLGRKAVGIDINPVAIFITRNTIKYVNPEKIRKEFKEIEREIKDDINGLYLTSCRRCKDNTLEAVCFTWDKGKLVDVRYECPYHGKMIVPVNEKDIELYEKIEQGELEDFFDMNGVSKYWYPTSRLYYNDGTPFKEKQRYESVDEILNPSPDSYCGVLISKNHNCDSACYNCLKEYRNMPYHAFLDWRLGLAYLRILGDQDYRCGLDAKFEFFPELHNWLKDAKKATQNFAQDFECDYTEYGILPGIVSPKAIIVHPLWRTDSYKQDIVADAAAIAGEGVQFIDTFKLSRRPGSSYLKLGESGDI